jgi:hypothetical protein
MKKFEATSINTIAKSAAETAVPTHFLFEHGWRPRVALAALW